MKRALIPGVLIALFAVGAATSSFAAQARPNFAGTWTLDTAKSVIPQGRGGGQGGGMMGGPVTIAVDGAKMSVSRTMGEGGPTTTTVYLLDGTASKNMMSGRGGQPMEIVYTSKWEGAKLVTAITTPRGTSTETRWLEADGTMVVESTRTNPQGETVTTKMVYRKS